MKRFIILILVLIITLFLSCTSQVKYSGKPVTITIAGGATGAELDLTIEAAQLFMREYPNITVRVLQNRELARNRSAVYTQHLNNKDSQLDVLQIDTLWPGLHKDHFLDLNQFEWLKTDTKKHFPETIRNNTVDGKLLAIPWFIDAGMLYYRMDLLQKYNLSIPHTWQDLEKAAKIIQAGERKNGNKNFWGYVWQGKAYEGLTCDALEWVASNGGGQIVSKNKKITINNPKAIEAVKMAANWIGTISPENMTNMAEEDVRKIWQNGNAAFMRNWPYAYSLGNTRNSPIKGKFHITTLPQGRSGSKKASTIGGWQLAVSKYSKHPEAAALLVYFLTSEKIQKIRAIKGFYNPTIMALYNDNEILARSPIFRPQYQVYMNSVSRPSTATGIKYWDTSKLFYLSIHSVLTGKQSAEKAMSKLEKQLQNLLGFPTGEPQYDY